MWKDLSLNDDLDEDERAELAVWDYPISDRFTKIWAAMTEANAYMGYNEAIHRVRSSQSNGREGNALVGQFTMMLSTIYNSLLTALLLMLMLLPLLLP